jgi:hypothetical protein
MTIVRGDASASLSAAIVDTVVSADGGQVTEATVEVEEAAGGEWEEAGAWEEGDELVGSPFLGFLPSCFECGVALFSGGVKQAAREHRAFFDSTLTAAAHPHRTGSSDARCDPSSLHLVILRTARSQQAVSFRPERVPNSVSPHPLTVLRRLAPRSARSVLSRSV